MITSKVPPAKRSMEKFLFQVKALLHNCSTEKKFWMGKSRNLIRKLQYCLVIQENASWKQTTSQSRAVILYATTYKAMPTSDASILWQATWSTRTCTVMWWALRCMEAWMMKMRSRRRLTRTLRQMRMTTPWMRMQLKGAMMFQWRKNSSIGTNLYIYLLLSANLTCPKLTERVCIWCRKVKSPSESRLQRHLYCSIE